MWDMRLKATSKQKHRQWFSGYQREGGEVEVEKGTGCHIYGDEKRFDFGW